MAAVETHEDRLYDRLRDGLQDLVGVTLHGCPEQHTPTLLFSVADRPGREVHEQLAAAGVNAPAGSFYALECSRWLGLGDNGAVRAGLAPYTSVDDVDRLLDVLAGLAAG